MKVLMLVLRPSTISTRLLVLRRATCMSEDVWFTWLLVVITDPSILCSVVSIWRKRLACVINR